MSKKLIRHQLSKAMIEELKKELEDLTTKRRREVAQRLSDARDYGDIGDNAEYDIAKEEQAFLEGRIAEIRNILRQNAQKGGSPVKKGGVQPGLKVKVAVGSKEREIVIVSRVLGDPLKGEISETSPLGRALLGKKVRDVVGVDAPAGTIRYTILEIS
jgi:transcription elongation factor GreA